MQPIPLISAEYVVRVAGDLEANCVPVERYLETARIPPHLRDAPIGFVPGRSLWTLAEEAERSQTVWVLAPTRREP